MPIFSQFGEIVWQGLFNIARILQTTALKSLPVSLVVLPVRLLFPWSSLRPYLALISSRFFSLSAFRLACCFSLLALAAACCSLLFRSSFAEIPSSCTSSLSASHPKLLPTDENLLETAALAIEFISFTLYSFFMNISVPCRTVFSLFNVKSLAMLCPGNHICLALYPGLVKIWEVTLRPSISVSAVYNTWLCILKQKIAKTMRWALSVSFIFTPTLTTYVKSYSARLSLILSSQLWTGYHFTTQLNLELTCLPML